MYQTQSQLNYICTSANEAHKSHLAVTVTSNHHTFTHRNEKQTTVATGTPLRGSGVPRHPEPHAACGPLLGSSKNTSVTACPGEPNVYRAIKSRTTMTVKASTLTAGSEKMVMGRGGDEVGTDQLANRWRPKKATHSAATTVTHHRGGSGSFMRDGIH